MVILDFSTLHSNGTYDPNWTPHCGQLLGCLFFIFVFTHPVVNCTWPASNTTKQSANKTIIIVVARPLSFSFSFSFSHLFRPQNKFFKSFSQQIYQPPRQK